MSINETQLEIDFKQWLRKLAETVEVRYGRRFESENGALEDSDYCTDCVDNEQARRLASGNEFNIIDGWDEAFEADSTSACKKCGCMIEFSPTQYYIDQEIEWLADAEEIGPWSAECLVRVLDNYDRETEWPLIRAAAERLMRAAGCEIVPDGFITFVPASNDWYASDSVWLSIYQHFAKQLVRWMKQTGVGEHGFLVNTSGRGIRHFAEITTPADAMKCVELLLQHCGENSDRGRFLAWMGIKELADLALPIRIVDTRCDLPTFDVRGLEMKKSPNKYHPKATILTHAKMQLKWDASRWVYAMYYSDKHHDPTSWSVVLEQKRRQSLPEFCDAIRAWMERKLVKGGLEDRWRTERLKKWDRVRDSLSTLFSMNSEQLEKMTDAFMKTAWRSLSNPTLKLSIRQQRTILSWLKKVKHDD